MSEEAMWEELLARWVPDDPMEPSDELRTYYEVKYNTACQLQAAGKLTSILEIGVRAGYSAFAFLSANPSAQFYGIDADVGGWGGQAGWIEKAAAVLHDFSVKIAKANTQQLHSIEECYPGQRFDFAHIDGDHSFDGCYHDLELCAAVSDVMLVDDYDFIAPVRAAVDHWLLRHHGRWGFAYISDGGFRGNMLIRRLPAPATPAPKSKDDAEGIRIAHALKLEVGYGAL